MSEQIIIMWQLSNLTQKTTFYCYQPIKITYISDNQVSDLLYIIILKNLFFRIKSGKLINYRVTCLPDWIKNDVDDNSMTRYWNKLI